MRTLNSGGVRHHPSSIIAICILCTAVVTLGQSSTPHASGSVATSNQVARPLPRSFAVTGGTGVAQSAPPSGSSTEMAIQAKDLLDANDRTISRVAQMYEKFATLITIFIGLLGLGVSIGAAVFAFFAFKSLRDFKKHWQGEIQEAKKKLGADIDLLKESAAKEVRLAIDHIRDNELKAQESATRAEASAAQLEQRQDVLDDYLTRSDALRAEVDGLRGLMRVAGLAVPPAPQPSGSVAQKPAVDGVENNEAAAVKTIVDQKVKPEGES